MEAWTAGGFRTAEWPGTAARTGPDGASGANGRVPHGAAPLGRGAARLGLERVDVDWTEPGDPTAIGVGPERVAHYRWLMREVGVPRGFYAFEPRDQISFMAYASGLSIRGQSKSYVWSPSGAFTDARVVDDLDAVWRSGQRRVWDYRHIDGPWYLHLRVD